jgi:Arc/MetJ-type ribon-helix-helix transcriptional regulator
VSDEINKAGVTSRKEKMEIRRRVTQNEYENESEAVKTAVREEYEKQKKGVKEVKMSHSSSIAERSPEDIAK